MEDGGRGMSISTRAATEQILDRFFGGLNDESRDAAETLVELFRETQASVLPYRRGATERWYGFATDARRARELQREVTAFVGPTWTLWSGAAAELDPNEPIEGIILAVAHGPVVRLDPVPGREGDVREALGLMAHLLRGRLAVELEVPRPRHRILSELELAYAAGNTRRARELIDEITATGTLGAINLLFLEIRLRDVVGDANAILDDPDLPDLIRRRRPTSVTFSIVRAVQARHLMPFEERWRSGDEHAPVAALESFGELSADFQVILADPKLDGLDEFVPVLVAHHVMRGEREEAADLISVTATPAAEWSRVLLEAAGPTSTVAEASGGAQAMDVQAPPHESLRYMFEQGAFEVLLKRAAEEVLDAPSIEYVVRAAYNLDTLEAAESAVNLLQAADHEAIEEARKDRALREAERALRDLFVPTDGDGHMSTIGSWRDWFKVIAKTPRFPAALSVAARGRYEWPATLMGDGRYRKELAAAILSCANSAESGAAALGGLPDLLEWLEAAPPKIDVSSIFVAALDLLLYAADSSDDRDSLSIRLFGQIAEARRDPDEIALRLSEFGDLWNEVAAPMRLDWPLALLDIAVDFAGRAEPVKEFFARILASVALWSDRIDRTHELTLRSIGSDLGEEGTVTAVLGAPLGERAKLDPLQVLAGKTVGVYSLTPGVQNRVVRLLGDRCPTAVVEINGDMVSTEQLRALAKKADVMVVAFRSAKHAATDAIVAVRGRENILPARGKGSAGVLRALEDWAAHLATTPSRVAATRV